MKIYKFLLWTIPCILFLLLAKGVEVGNKVFFCQFYNKAECIQSQEKGHTRGCPITKSCGTTENGERYKCFVQWAYNNNNEPFVTEKGCFPNYKNCYNESYCKYRRDITLKYTHCCCEYNLCNIDLKIDVAHVHSFEEHSETSEAFYSIFITIAFAVVFFLFFALCCYVLYKYTKCEGPTSVETTPLVHNTEYRLNVNHIQLTEKLQVCRLNCLWKAQYRNNEVAVKIYKRTLKEMWTREKEIFELLHATHPNVVHLIGVTKSPANDYWLVTGFYQLGSLYDYLKDHTLSWRELCLISETMTRGLAFLHEQNYNINKKFMIAHLNFRSKSVLLNNDLTACITDFSLALAIESNTPCEVMYAPPRTIKYMAPEILMGANASRTTSFLQVDMYTYALVLWELVSSYKHCESVYEYKLPYEEHVGADPDFRDMHQCVVLEGIRPTIQEAWRKHPGLKIFCFIMEKCWENNADARPSASTVLKKILALPARNTNVFEISMMERITKKICC